MFLIEFIGGLNHAYLGIKIQKIRNTYHREVIYQFLVLKCQQWHKTKKLSNEEFKKTFEK